MLAATRGGKNSENKSIPMKINPHACYIMIAPVESKKKLFFEDKNRTKFKKWDRVNIQNIRLKS